MYFIVIVYRTEEKSEASLQYFPASAGVRGRTIAILGTATILPRIATRQTHPSKVCTSTTIRAHPFTSSKAWAVADITTFRRKASWLISTCGVGEGVSHRLLSKSTW